MQVLFPATAPSAKPVRRGAKLGGNSLSNQFREQLNDLINTINESVPRYVRCIKPNSIASSRPMDMDSDAVKEQLRAGSILEAVRIRKIGYGYRMAYDDFGYKFWPIIGQRIYENDHDITKKIFLKGSSIVDTSEQRRVLKIGPDQAWQCGRTKVFMKDTARFAIESALNKIQSQKATSIQCRIRQVLALKTARARRSARH